jgi:nucleoid-associated protein YgaU
MKQNNVTDLPRLNAENLENMFNVHQDANGMYFYNLLQTIEFPQNLPLNLFTSYTVKYGDTWPFISYKTLNSPNLWWTILLANNIQDPTNKGKPLVPGTIIKIPRMEVVKEILSQIGR